MFTALFIVYLIWAIPVWLEACDEVDYQKEKKGFSYNNY